MRKEHVIGWVDLDGVMANYEEAAAGRDKEEYSVKGFFENLNPIDDAIWAFGELSKHFEMHFLSTGPWSNVHSLSEKRIWVEKHLGELAFKKLTTSHVKHLMRGKFLIDDRTANGAGDFQGEHIHIFTDPRFMSWKAVVEYLIDKYANKPPEPLSTYVRDGY